MRKNTLLETVTAIVFLIFIGVILYYSFYPFKVTTLNSIGIDGAEYCRGDWVEVEIDFQKHMDIQGDITWYIVDGIVYELDAPGITRPGGDNHIVTLRQVPYSILPGRYNLRVEAAYDVHPFHKTIVNTWNTPTFTVLEADQCPPIPANPDKTPPELPQQPRPVQNSSVESPAPVAGASAQQSPVVNQPEQNQSAVVVTEQQEPQVVVQEHPPTPVKDLLKKVLKPVGGLL
jgi:hypothetical protein